MTLARPIIGEERIKDIRQLWYSFRSNILSLIGLFIVVSILFIGLSADYLAPYPEDVSALHTDRIFQPPSSTHIMGTDGMGRDVFSRVLFGSRISLVVVVEVMVIALGLGIPIGLISGYVGGAVDSALMRITEVFMSIPPVILAICICVVLPRSLENSMMAIALSWWPMFARITRGEVLHIKQETYVEASRSFGAGVLHICARDILPNILTPIIIRASLSMGTVILSIATLGFLGLGALPPIPEWGTMASGGRNWMPVCWWLTTFPSLAIFATVFGLNAFGDGLRDALIRE